MLTPIMASRLMLSLKKASVQPTGPWSMSAIAAGASKAGETFDFSSGTPGVGRRASGALSRPTSDEGDLELDSM